MSKKTVKLKDLTLGGGRIYIQSMLNVPAGDVEGSVAQAKLKAKVLRPSENGSRRIEISNCSLHTAYNLKMNLVDRESGEIILPAYFSDGYFHLLPGEKKIVEVTCRKDGAVSIEGYNVDSHIIVR